MKVTNESKVIDYQLLESEANIFSLKSLIFTQIIHGVVWLLNVLNIFIVDSDLMNRSFFGSCTVALITILICAVLGTKRPQIKYIIMIALVIEVTIVNINLTYHTVLFFCIALIVFYSVLQSKDSLFFLYIVSHQHFYLLHGRLFLWIM